MQQARLMTLDEKFATGFKAIELEKQGKHEEAMRLKHQIPLAPYMAKFIKDHLGSEALLSMGWNLAEAEAEYGPDWLSR